MHVQDSDNTMRFIRALKAVNKGVIANANKPRKLAQYRDERIIWLGAFAAYIEDFLCLRHRGQPVPAVSVTEVHDFVKTLYDDKTDWTRERVLDAMEKILGMSSEPSVS